MVILLLPSFLTLITLLVHRIRASRAAQRDRAPEDIVKNLPWRVWNGTRWEKSDGTPHINTLPNTGDVSDPVPDSNLTVSAGNEGDEELDRVEQGSSRIHLPWYTTQAECAICLEEFAVGDKVRVLPCEHVFHMNEIDDWLINRKKLVSVISLPHSAASGLMGVQLTGLFLELVFSVPCVSWTSRWIIQTTNHRQPTRPLRILLSTRTSPRNPKFRHRLGKLLRFCDRRTHPLLLVTRGKIFRILSEVCSGSGYGILYHLTVGQFSPFFLGYFDDHDPTPYTHAIIALRCRNLCVCILNDYDICRCSTRYLRLAFATDINC